MRSGSTTGFPLSFDFVEAVLPEHWTTVSYEMIRLHGLSLDQVYTHALHRKKARAEA